MKCAIDKNIKEIIYLAAAAICLVCFFIHIMQNLLSYDDTHNVSIGDRGLLFYAGNESVAKISWRITVNLDELKLYVYRNDVLYKKYPCSGGKGETPSPTGDYKIISNERRGEVVGGIWLGLNVPWGNYGIHGTKFPWVVGNYNASNGCIRLLTKDAHELSKYIPKGTPVKIVQKNRKFRAMKTGDKGSDVRDLEIALSSLEYFEGKSDGRFGIDLAIALIRFQAENKLNATGIVDYTTYQKILAKVRRLSS